MGAQMNLNLLSSTAAVVVGISAASVALIGTSSSGDSAAAQYSSVGTGTPFVPGFPGGGDPDPGLGLDDLETGSSGNTCSSFVTTVENISVDGDISDELRDLANALALDPGDGLGSFGEFDAEFNENSGEGVITGELLFFDFFTQDLGSYDVEIDGFDYFNFFEDSRLGEVWGESTEDGATRDTAPYGEVGGFPIHGAVVSVGATMDDGYFHLSIMDPATGGSVNILMSIVSSDTGTCEGSF